MKKLIFCLLLLFSANVFARNYVTPTSCYGVVYNSPDDAAAGLVSRNYIGGMGGAYIQSANVIAWGDNGQAVHVTYSWYSDFQSPMTANVCSGDVVPIPTCIAPQILNAAQSACEDPPPPECSIPPGTQQDFTVASPVPSSIAFESCSFQLTGGCGTITLQDNSSATVCGYSTNGTSVTGSNTPGASTAGESYSLGGCAGSCLAASGMAGSAAGSQAASADALAAAAGATGSGQTAAQLAATAAAAAFSAAFAAATNLGANFTAANAAATTQAAAASAAALALYAGGVTGTGTGAITGLAGQAAADISAAAGGTAEQQAAAAAAAAQSASASAGGTLAEQIAAAAAAAGRAAAGVANSEYTGLQGEIAAAAAAASAAALAAGATAEQAAAAAAAARAAAAEKPDYQASPYDHEQGVPSSDGVIPSITHALEYVSVSFFGVAGCPAPLTYTMMGHSYELTFDKICEVMLMIRPVILMVATATAAMIFIGAF